MVPVHSPLIINALKIEMKYKQKKWTENLKALYVEMTMQLARFLLLRIPAPTISTAAAFSHNSSSFVGSCQSVAKTRLTNHWSFQYHNASRFWCHLNSKLQNSVQHLCHSPGRNLHLGKVFGFSFITGFLSAPPQYALAEADQRTKYWDQSVSSGTQDEGPPKFLLWARKLLIPMLLVMTVVMGWNYPVSLVINVVFILLSTKPTPSSIYLWAEEWRQQNIPESHGFDWLKLGKPLHVEVQDYKLLCLAQITSLNQKMLMIGMLGEWWILYSSSSRFNFGPLSVTSPFTGYFD